MQELPLEVWALVLAQPPLTLADLGRAALTCRAFSHLVRPITAATGGVPSQQSRLQGRPATARQWRLVNACVEHPITTLAISNVGERIASKYWQRVVEEHDLMTLSRRASSTAHVDAVVNARLSDRALSGLGVHFRHSETEGLVASGIFARSDNTPDLPKAPLRHLFGNYFSCVETELNTNWAIGHCGTGAQFAETILERVRREMERTDNAGSILMFHSAAGAMGGGTGSLVLAQLRDAHPDAHLVTCTVGYGSVPPPQMMNEDIYNTVMTMGKLIQHADECFMALKEEMPMSCMFDDTYSSAMAGVTNAIRFPTLAHGDGVTPSSLADLCGQLVSGDLLRLLSLSYAMRRQRSIAASPRELVERLWWEESLSAWSSASERKGRTLGSFAHFQLSNTTDRLSRVVDAIAAEAAITSVSASAQPRLTFGRLHPSAPKWSVTRVGNDFARISGTLVSNSTSIAVPLSIIHAEFRRGHRKTVLRWYMDEGMDEFEFEEAGQCLGDVIQAYQSHDDQT